jgi:hypothetical protein
MASLATLRTHLRFRTARERRRAVPRGLALLLANDGMRA